MRTEILLLTLLIAGCSENKMPDDRVTNGEDIETAIIFQLGVPGGNEVEYGRSIPADKEENEVYTMKVYDFQVKESAQSDGRDTLFTGAYFLEKTDEETPHTGSFTNKGGIITARISLSAKLNSEHVFVFVANEGVTRFDSIAQTDTIPLEELRKIPIDRLRKTPSTRLPGNGDNTDVLMKNGAVMTTDYYLSITEEMIAAGKINISSPLYLQRIVARVDVVDRVDASMNFKLVSVGVKGTAAQGYLFERGSDGGRTASLCTGTVELVQNSEMSMDETTRPYTYKKALYLYESDAVRPPTLVVTYTLNGSRGTQEVEMKDNVTNQPFDIRRNWVYTLEIGDIKSAALSCQMGREEIINKE